ncbi:glycosyltransferase family A protein [Pengzhenrongella sicca]|uniref:glycosyltransferase family A protein n=1 Tax=Pengzhenrongella sicca TaxID=2819238 RepID=UPI001D0C36F8|nr:glycosyltransferase family A protein [Pengzhenrongella sicca]
MRPAPLPADLPAPLSVSVVIPVKDDAVLLDRALSFLARQDVLALEIVVVDNGSRDNSAEVARRHGARVVVEPRPGIAAAASTGYDAALGAIILRCDADTLAPPDWLGRVRAQFAADDDLDALTGGGTFYDVATWRAAVVGRLYLRSYYVAAHAALAHPTLWGSNMAIRATSWHGVSDTVHRGDAHLHDDFDLAFTLGPTSRIRYDPTLTVEVSGRSLQGGPAGRVRWARAFHTLAVNWAVMSPSRRWATRLALTRPPAAADGRRPRRRIAARERELQAR